MTLIEDIRQKEPKQCYFNWHITKYDTPLKGYFLSQILYQLLKRNQSQGLSGIAVFYLYIAIVNKTEDTVWIPNSDYFNQSADTWYNY